MNKKLHRESTLIYRSIYNVIKKLPQEQQLKSYNAIFSYGFDGKILRVSGMTKSVFELAKPLIDANNRKYFNRKGKKAYCEDTVYESEIAGTNEEQTRNKKEQTKNKRGTKQEQTRNKTCSNVNVNVNENVNANANEREYRENASVRPSRFVEPSVEEVQSYCERENIQVDPKRFCAYYAAKGWRIGNSPMRDWQAAIRGWERLKIFNTPEQPQAIVGGTKIDRREYSDEQLQALFTKLEEE